jgi:hypothetical protein
MNVKSEEKFSGMEKFSAHHIHWKPFKIADGQGVLPIKAERARGKIFRGFLIF